MEKESNGVLDLGFETLAEFYERAKTARHPTWLIHEVVPATGSVMLAGVPGASKTWLCLAVAKQAVLEKRRVFFIEEEGSTYGFAKRFEAMSIPGDASIWVLHRKNFRVDVIPKLASLCASMVPVLDPVVILDPLTLLWVGDENSTKDVSELVQRFQALRNFEDALIVVPTHASKVSRSAEGGSNVYSARGSSVLPGWFDCVLNIEKAKSESGSISMVIDPVKLRELDQNKKRVLTIRLGAGEVEISTERDDRSLKAKSEIVDFVTVSGEVSKHQIEKAIGGRAVWIRRLIDELLEAGELAQSTSSRNGTFLLKNPRQGSTSSVCPIRTTNGTKSPSSSRTTMDEVGRSNEVESDQDEQALARLRAEAHEQRQQSDAREYDAEWERMRGDKK